MYLNVEEVNSALASLETAYPALCRRVPLPNQTHEGRSSWALWIGKRDTHKGGGVLFTACLHAREWGGAEICIYFASDLLEAYTAGTGLQYGGKRFTASQIKTIVEHREVFVFACVNPDGRHYSQTSDPMWRKNRNPASSGGSPWKIGVDVNRNFDFLWNSQKHFHPVAAGSFSMGSANPASDMYHGPSPHSEPETRNVVWLLDQFPQIQWLIDIHSYTGTVLHPWCDAPNQLNDQTKNFRNPAFDGVRGLDNVNVYGEYLPIVDYQSFKQLAEAVRQAIEDVRGQNYYVDQSFYLKVAGGADETYPTGGVSDDYAYSRHAANPSMSRVMGLTIEFSKVPDFNPPWSQMEPIVSDIDAGLIQFCLLAEFPLPSDPDKWSKSARILFGVINDGGGIIFGPHGEPIPIPPWDPWVRDVLSGLLIYHLAERIQSPVGHTLQQQALDLIQKAAAGKRT